jgi:hypothetical protein
MCLQSREFLNVRHEHPVVHDGLADWFWVGVLAQRTDRRLLAANNKSPPKQALFKLLNTKEFGERAGARTQDQRLKRAMLYQLSYPLAPYLR